MKNGRRENMINWLNIYCHKNAKWKVISHEVLFATKHNAGYGTIFKGICYGKQKQIVFTHFLRLEYSVIAKTLFTSNKLHVYQVIGKLYHIDSIFI